MSPIYKYNGKILSVLEGGVRKLAVNQACCCGSTTTTPPPPPPEGACCTGDGCEILTEDDCDAQGGFWNGAGTNCDPIGPLNDICAGACCQFLWDGFNGVPPNCTDNQYINDCDNPDLFMLGVLCGPETCVAPPDDCLENTDCPPCECCDEGECVPAEECPAPQGIDITYCGANIPFNLEFEIDLNCAGQLVCAENPDLVINFNQTKAWIMTGLVEKAECGAAQNSPIPAAPRNPRFCRYIYSVDVTIGDGADNKANPCEKRRYIGYIDVDPCAPQQGALAFEEDPAGNFNAPIPDPCLTQVAQGCYGPCMGLCPNGPAGNVFFAP